MTLLVRDEADIIDDHIAFHLAAGVDFVIVADNGSTDGTTEILERYARDGFVHRIGLRDPFSQVDVVTRVARLTATPTNSGGHERERSRSCSVPCRLGSAVSEGCGATSSHDRRPPDASRRE